MPGRIRHAGSCAREILSSGWELACAAPDANAPADWDSIQTLDTVAAALRARGEWSVEAAPRRFDAQDWWLRRSFDAPAAPPGARVVLGLDGLASITRVWLNGESLLESSNMFHEHEIVLGQLKPTGNELLLQFRSLDGLLTARRPRPRWRAPMIENQQLRWFRTTLLGRTPGWSPPAAPVGAWRPIWIEARTHFDLHDLKIRSTLDGSAGIVEIECRLESLTRSGARSAELIVSRQGESHRVMLQARDGTDRVAARLRVPQVARWWPHTHGEPALYQARLIIDSAELDLGRIGFRSVEVDTSDGNFELRINGVSIFCRGASWTPLDAVSPHSDGPEVDTAVAQARDAGFNMLRVSGTMVYESDRFLDACDAEGMLLWQDFMFANMEYPRGDAAFESSVRLEAAQLLRRFNSRPCLTVLCGNSEAAQQAAMWGAPREWWAQDLFDDVLRGECAEHAPDIPYWPSSAYGGAFPHQADAGTTSYYGVGAYRRPFDDARRSALRFATECLAFANVPQEVGLKVHDPAWKARVPRDLGAGWDFDDVRDHYLKEIFRVDPLELRAADHARYLQLSRLASAEAMAAAFREWRRGSSGCHGALVWFLRDLWHGAGWGLMGADGAPKAPWYTLRRLLQAHAIFLTDEGGNGLHAHATNESADILHAQVQTELYRADGVRVGNAQRVVELAARSTLAWPVAADLPGFMDLTYAYRFGPPPHEVVIVRLLAADTGKLLAEDFYFPLGQDVRLTQDPVLEATATLQAGGAEITMRSHGCARHVRIDVPGFSAEDQYFHLAPGKERRIALRRLRPDATLQGTVEASNSRAPVRIAIAQ